MIFTIIWELEICCEYCNEVIHNHMHCPQCNDTNAGTTVYGGCIEKDEKFECEECGVRLKAVDISNLKNNEIKVKIVE